VQQEKQQQSSQVQERLFRFELPEVKEVEGYYLLTKDKKVIARTKDELEEMD